MWSQQFLKMACYLPKVPGYKLILHLSDYLTKNRKGWVQKYEILQDEPKWTDFNLLLAVKESWCTQSAILNSVGDY